MRRCVWAAGDKIDITREREQGASDGCRGWEEGREGDWVKDLDVAAWCAVLSLPGSIGMLAPALLGPCRLQQKGDSEET